MTEALGGEQSAYQHALDLLFGLTPALAPDNARLYQEAQDAVRARDEFLSIASHELRTPVTAIKGTVQTLLRAMHRGGPLEEARLVRALEQVDQGTTVSVWLPCEGTQ